MKVRVYDSGKDVADRYTLYFPYPKWLREHDGRTIMGCFQPFNFGIDLFGEGYINLFAWDYDDRSLGYNIPQHEKKVKIESMPKVVRDYAAKTERLWNNALKFNDDEHWNKWLAV